MRQERSMILYIALSRRHFLANRKNLPDLQLYAVESELRIGI